MSSDTTFRHESEAYFARPIFPDAAYEASSAATEYDHDMRYNGARGSRNGGQFSGHRRPRGGSHTASASSHYSHPPMTPATSRSAPVIERAGNNLLSPMQQLHNMNSALSVQSGMCGIGRYRHGSSDGNPGSAPTKCYEHNFACQERDPYGGSDSFCGRGASRENFAHNRGCSRTWRSNDDEHRDRSDQHHRARRNNGHRLDMPSRSEYHEPPPGMPLSPVTCDVPAQVSVVRHEQRISPRSEVAYSGSYDRHYVNNDYGNFTREYGHHPQHGKQTIDRPSSQYHDEGNHHYSSENRAPHKEIYHPAGSFQYQYPEKRDDYSSSTINTPSTHPSTFQPSGSHPSHASGITTLVSRPQQQLPPDKYCGASNDRTSHNKLTVSIPQSPAHQQSHVSESFHSGSDSYKRTRLTRAEREYRLSHARHQILKEISQATHMRETALDEKDTLFWTRQVNTLNESLKRL